MNEIVTFFMIVTDPDIILADYAVRSYQKLTEIPFKLRIYSNWVSAESKKKYFVSWRKYAFVDIESNEWQDNSDKPQDSRLEGPFEKCTTIWDRELKRIETPYIATVDADFEVLNPKFIPVMLAKLQANPKLGFISTDYSPKIPEYYDSYSNEVICLNERWHTWFCIYRKEALKADVSHYYYEQIFPGKIRRNAWDSSGYLQKKIRDEYGYEGETLDKDFQPCFIHYGAFSKNRTINEHNVGLYRTFSIWGKRGFIGNDRIGRIIGNRFLDIVFPRSARSYYWSGWGMPQIHSAKGTTKENK